MDEAFTEEEQTALKSFGDTEIVSLLSEKEVLKYFDSAEKRVTNSTDYARERGLPVSSKTNRSDWWIKADSNDGMGDTVGDDGRIVCARFVSDNAGVRPIIRVVY